MQEKCEEFGDRMIKHVPQADQREVLTAMLEDISSEYVTFSVHAIGDSLVLGPVYINPTLCQYMLLVTPLTLVLIIYAPVYVNPTLYPDPPSLPPHNHPHTPARPLGYLARSVLKDLEEPVFAQLFTAEWENNYGESLSSVIVATLQDYFQDVKIWLPDYFYCKFVKEVLFTLTGLYVMQVTPLVQGTYMFTL